ncbi:Hsp20/alpha crystallin family protein [Paenactinomyces guangxiensis]|nr:Hsp20/alpha crystallin family protein [Paenactinomyces guangxiensis]
MYKKHETDDDIIFYFKIPGLSKDKNIKVFTCNQTLTVKGNFSVENSYRHFQHTISIPSNTDVDGIKSIYKNDILEIRLPKEEEPANLTKNINIEFDD